MKLVRLLDGNMQLFYSVVTYMFAVIRTGGKQYNVSPGQKILIEKLPVAVGESISFDEVLLIADPVTSDLKLGKPTVSGAKVIGTVLEQGRAPKVSVIKYKRKVRYRRNRSHRQPFTAVQIERIEV